MKISEILEKMEDFTDDEREKYLGGMWSKVTDVSKNTLMGFQNAWDGSKGFDAFKKEQNKLVKECIQMEIMINDVKEKNGLEVFTMETEIA